MKKRFPTFLAGFLCALLLVSLPAAVSATIVGHTQIGVDPIKIMVNGAEFQPKDPNGNPVDVFVYNGTTYAPLRALAEAYGLTVGYDAERHMATVSASNSSDQSPVTQPTTSTVKFYPAYPDVPDFGALFNVPCAKNFSSQGVMMYLYNISSLPTNCTIEYGDLIHDQFGFRFLGDFPDSSGNTVIAFTNGIHSVSIGTMWVDNAGYIAIMISQGY